VAADKLSAKKICKRFEQLKADRTTWESHWRECATYMLPNRSDINTVYSPGQKRNLVLLDSTGVQSNELLAGALHGMLTNPSGQWFMLTTGNPEIDDLDDVRKWLQNSSRKMLNVFNGSNFQTEVHQYYLDLPCIGTAGFSIEEDEDQVVRFAARHIKELYIAENNKGQIDEIYRSFQWTARQIVQQFGEKVLELSRNLKRAYEKGVEDKFELIQAIYPRDAAKVSTAKFRYVSQFILKSVDEVELSEGQFRELPLVVPRWTKASGEVYGRGPGMNALPDVKTLNKMTETVLIGAQKAVDPPVQAPDDGFVMPLKTRPGGVSYYRAGSQDRIEPVFNDTRVDFGFEVMRERRERIKQTFYIDQLQLNTGPQMTATEVMQRTEERMRLLGPMLGRQQSEFLRPLIDRVFEIMQRKGMIDEAPEVLRGRQIDVAYTSMIAQAQRVAEAQSISKTMDFIAPFVQADQSVLDNLNGDAALKFAARVFNFPQEIIRDADEVEQKRKARADAQAQAVAQEQQAKQIDGAAKLGPTAIGLEQLSKQA